MARLTPGLWQGAYRYDPRNLEVPFEMRVRSAAAKRLEGSIRSEQFPEPGVLSGAHRLLHSQFTVQYPRLRVVAQDSTTLGLRELVEDQFGVVPANDLPHPLIYYSTTRSFRRGSVRGTWEMPNSSIVDEESGWRIDFPTCTGTWWATRVGESA